VQGWGGGGEARSLIRFGLNAPPLHEINTLQLSHEIHDLHHTACCPCTRFHRHSGKSYKLLSGVEETDEECPTDHTLKRDAFGSRTQQSPTCCSPDASRPDPPPPVPPFVYTEPQGDALFWRAVSAGCTKHAIERHELFAWEQGQSTHHHPEQHFNSLCAWRLKSRPAQVYNDGRTSAPHMHPM